jgi:hypothetical protein
MVLGREAHPEHLWRQPMDGERPQLAVSQREQGGRVAPDHGTHDREETLIAIGRSQALGEVDREAVERGPGLHV